jgi:hypothetical protein
MKKVYVVVGGFEYKGESSDSLELFKSKDAAEDYASFLRVLEGYDYTIIEEREVK